MSTRIALADGVVLELDHQAVEALQRQLLAAADQASLEAPPSGQLVGKLETLPDEHPLWERHTGGAGHSAAPEWGAGDGDLAVAFYASVRGKAKVFLDLLLDHSGELLTTDVICSLAPATFASDRAIAGSLNGLRKPKDQSGRRYPFYWWEGTPTRYAIKPSVAALFRDARARLGG